MSSNPSRFPTGVATAAQKNSTLWSLPAPDPLKLHVEFVDFTGIDYVAAQWTVTETQGAATQALVAASAGGEYGLLHLVNAAGASDINSIQLTTASLFISDTSKKWWLEGRVSRNNADAAIGFGVQEVNATPFAVVGGIWIAIAGASTSAVFSINKASAATSATQTAAYPTSALDTFVKLGMYYNGKDAIGCFVDGVQVGSITTLTNLPNASALTPTVSMQNTTANARQADVDYLYFAVER